MRTLKNTASRCMLGSPIMLCTVRNKRRMRTAVATLLAFLLFLFFVLPGSDVPCSGDVCNGVTKTHPLTFTNRTSFVTTFPQRQWRNASVKRILRWTGFFTDPTWEETDDRYFAPCEESRCTMTNDRSLLDQSDAVLFHSGALFNFWRGHEMPDHRLPHQVWILHNVEPPTRTPLNLATLAGVFNWTAWYRRDSDVPVPYGGYTVYPGDRYGSNYSVNFARHNHRFAAWMSSNCYDYNRRQLIIRRLKELLGSDLDLYGGCNEKRCPETICSDTLSNYKFYLALENANCRDYVTEKFWSALARKQVPVVLGGASSEDYRKIAPPNSFLHINDFRSLEHLAQHLRHLSQDEAAYNLHLQWTRHYEVHSELPARRKWWCDLCSSLHDKSKPAQVYSDLQGWVQDDVCPQWTLGNQIGRYVDGIKFKIGIV
ncbi:alpha-(1,3)-fucosyltransferase C-like [Littorina saxatilis]|uniref:alpha-(1,3)-fucosyltransferase C-like n=1 Tax=Littorina saxatilis TaxID=31220 RepID=UPI0038B477E0